MDQVNAFLERKNVKISLKRYGIDALGAMAQGLFASLLIGTIMNTLGTQLGISLLVKIGGFATSATGAAMAISIGYALQAPQLVLFSLTAVGIAANSLGGAGGPLAVLVVAIIASEAGKIVSKETKVDILVTPLIAILSGAAVGIFVGPYISKFMGWLGELVNVNVEAHPIIGGIIVSVLMGMILTLPISSAAIGISMSISGLAAGAATIGCCCNMVGFAVASYRENKMGGLIAQGVGTSMLQVPNIIKKPIIWLPAIISSAILGPIASAVLHMVSTPVGSGMGSAGFVGQFAAYSAMTADGMSGGKAMLLIIIMHFILPAAVTLAISEGMRKLKLIKEGDMKLEV